jgi:hypothetical protein
MPQRDDEPKRPKERKPEEEIILLEDLAPPEDVKGGGSGTILFGEDLVRDQEKK